jgi:hypothetical protein
LKAAGVAPSALVKEERMGVTVELFPLGTVEGNASGSYYQDISETIDTSRYNSAVLSGQVIGAANLTSLLIEGSDDGQDFVTALTISGTAPAEGLGYLNPQSAGSTHWSSRTPCFM